VSEAKNKKQKWKKDSEMFLTKHFSPSPEANIRTKMEERF
jgi:hypothetical protein